MDRPEQGSKTMAYYRTSTLSATAPGQVETIEKFAGDFFGGDRIPAFMGLAKRTGGVYLENPPSIAEGLKATGLDFEVRLERVQALVAQDGISAEGEPVTMHTAIDVPGYRCTTVHYNDGRQPVPVSPWVTPTYQPVQNTEALAVGQEIIREGFGTLAALGAWGKPLGSKVYAAFALDGMLVGGQDPHGLVLTVTTAHDGNGGLSFRLAPLRFACTNETPLYFGSRAQQEGNRVFTRKHTKNVMRDAAVYAQQALDLSTIYRKTFVAAADRALDIKISENRAITYWRQVFGVPADPSEWAPRVVRRSQDREDALLALLNGPTCEFGRETAWGAFNAATEYMQHLAPVRGRDEAAARQRRLVEGQLDMPTQRAWNLAMAL